MSKSTSASNQTSATTDSDQINEEEFLVLVEFTDSNEAKYSQENSNKFKVLEIENKNPIIQIGNRLYSGEYQNNIGTYLFFNQNTTQPTTDDDLNSSQSSTSSSTAAAASSQTQSSFKYSGKTYKKLILNRMYIKPKEQEIIEDDLK